METNKTLLDAAYVEAQQFSHYDPDLPINWALLRRCYRLVSAKPPTRFYLNTFVEHNQCGTLACAAGWFVNDTPEYGWRVDGDYVRFGQGDHSNYAQAMSRAFNIQVSQAYKLFNRFGDSPYDSTFMYLDETSTGAIHLRAWQHRMQCFFIEHGQKLED